MDAVKAITIKEVAAALSVSTRTAERLIATKQLPAFKLSIKKRAAVRVRLLDLSRFIERNKVA